MSYSFSALAFAVNIVCGHKSSHNLKEGGAGRAKIKEHFAKKRFIEDFFQENALLLHAI